MCVSLQAKGNHPTVKLYKIKKKWNFKKQSYLHQTVRKINPTKWIGVQKRPLHPAAMSTRLLHKGKAKSVKIKIKKIKKIKIKRNCWVVGCRDSPAVVSILPVVCLVVEEVVQTDIQQKCAKEKVVAKWKTFLGTSIPTLVLARVNFFFSTSIFFVRVFFFASLQNAPPLAPVTCALYLRPSELRLGLCRNSNIAEMSCSELSFRRFLRPQARYRLSNHGFHHRRVDGYPFRP